MRMEEFKMRNRENVYAHVEEKHVMTVKVYANKANVLFYDKACEKAVLADIVEDLFLNRLLSQKLALYATTDQKR